MSLERKRTGLESKQQLAHALTASNRKPARMSIHNPASDFRESKNERTKKDVPCQSPVSQTPNDLPLLLQLVQPRVDHLQTRNLQLSHVHEARAEEDFMQGRIEEGDDRFEIFRYALERVSRACVEESHPGLG